MGTIDITITNRRGLEHKYTLDAPDDQVRAFAKMIEQSLTELGAQYTLNRLVRLSDGATIIEINASPGYRSHPRRPDGPAHL